MKYYVLTILLLSIYVLPVCSQENTDQTGLSGFVEADHISYFENQENKINGRNQVILFLEYQNTIKKSSSFYSSLEFREDFSDPSRRRTYIDEAYIKSNYKYFDFTLGKQIITWGKADAINPTNNINPIDYTDLLDTDDETMGIFALNTNLYYKNFKLQGVFVPVFTSSLLPTDSTSRWFRQVDLSEIPVAYSRSYSTNRPGSDLRSNQYALSLGYFIGGWDFSISYYNGYNHIPDLEHNVIPVSADSVIVNLNQNFYKHEVLGFDFSTTVGKFGLRGEAAYFMPNGLQEDNDYLRYVIGVDRNISNIIGYNNLFILVQWIHELVEDNYKFSNLDLNHLFQESIMSRVEMDVGSSASITIQGVYNLDSDDYYIRPTMKYNLFDGLNLELLADILDGADNSFFSLYKENKRFQFKLKYNF